VYKSSNRKSPSPDQAEYPRTSAPIDSDKALSGLKTKLKLMLPKSNLLSTEELSNGSKSKPKSIGSWNHGGNSSIKLLPSLLANPNPNMHSPGNRKTPISGEISANSSLKWQSSLNGFESVGIPHETYERRNRKKTEGIGQLPFFVIKDYAPQSRKSRQDMKPKLHQNSYVGSIRSAQNSLEKQQPTNVLRAFKGEDSTTDICMSDTMFKQKYGDGLLKFVRHEEDKYNIAKELYMKRKAAALLKQSGWGQDHGYSQSNNNSTAGSEMRSSQKQISLKYYSDSIVPSKLHSAYKTTGGTSDKWKAPEVMSNSWLGFNMFDNSKRSVQNESYQEHMQHSQSLKSRMSVMTPVKNMLWFKERPDQNLRISPLSQIHK
jgi:hypothetical protein